MGWSENGQNVVPLATQSSMRHKILDDFGDVNSNDPIPTKSSNAKKSTPPPATLVQQLQLEDKTFIKPLLKAQQVMFSNWGTNAELRGPPESDGDSFAAGVSACPRAPARVDEDQQLDEVVVDGARLGEAPRLHDVHVVRPHVGQNLHPALGVGDRAQPHPRTTPSASNASQANGKLIFLTVWRTAVCTVCLHKKTCAFLLLLHGRE